MSALDWDRDGADWPNREYSRFETAAGLTWHVQEAGSGPPLILIHGTGAATHSWAGLLPLLANDHRVIAFDLPGHGFTSSPPPSRLTLPYMAEAVAALLRHLNIANPAIVTHSAGTAIAARTVLDGFTAPRLVGLNAALLPFGGIANQLFPAMARMLFVNPFVPGFFAWRAGDLGTVRRLIEGTGSQIEEIQLRRYARLFQSQTHVAAALGMMANWDLPGLERALPGLKVPLTLLTATHDKAIPPDVAFRVQKLVPGTQVDVVRGLGHLCHEENPKLLHGLLGNILTDTVASTPPGHSPESGTP
jgi:magnesium chelatase accessory protein